MMIDDDDDVCCLVVLLRQLNDRSAIMTGNLALLVAVRLPERLTATFIPLIIARVETCARMAHAHLCASSRGFLKAAPPSLRGGSVLLKERCFLVAVSVYVVIALKTVCRFRPLILIITVILKWANGITPIRPQQ